jgi:hypothetical protein
LEDFYTYLWLCEKTVFNAEMPFARNGFFIFAIQVFGPSEEASGEA